MSIIGTELRRARLEEAYDELKSQGGVRNRTDFAEMLGVTPGYLSSRLKGVVDIGEEFALNVEQVYGVSSKWLLAGERLYVKSKNKIRDDADANKLLQQMSLDIRILKEQVRELQRVAGKQ